MLTDRVVAQKRPVMVMTQYKTGRSAVLVGNPVLGAGGEAARLLGVSQPTAYRKLHKYGVLREK